MWAALKRSRILLSLRLGEQEPRLRWCLSHKLVPAWVTFLTHQLTDGGAILVSSVIDLVIFPSSTAVS